MKKIIAVVSLVGFTGVLAAQEPPTKQLSIQEANRLNGTPKEPTINGKPYSQYKAEQEALKRQREAAKPAAQTGGLLAIKASDAKEPAKAQSVQPTGPDAGTAPAPVKVTEAAVVKTEPRQTAPAPEVPAQFRLNTEYSFGDPAAQQAVAQQTQPVLPAAANGGVGQDQSGTPAPYKTKELPAGNAPKGKETVDPVPAKVEAAVVSKEIKANPAPQVPDQFKLPAAQGWNGRAVAAETALVKGNAAQPVDKPVSEESYKNPVIKDGNKPSGDEGKTMESKPARNVEASVVITAPKKAVATEQLPGLGLGEAPAAKQQAAKPVTGTSADPSAAALDKPVHFKPAPEAVAPATEKPSFRTAADAPKQVEANTDKAQKPAEKNTTSIPAAAGTGNGETSKVTVPEVKFPQQEKPKKD